MIIINELYHKGSIKLETERLIIRKYSPEDAQEIFNKWANDPVQTRGNAWKYHTEVSETEKMVANIINGYKYPQSYNWIIALKDTDEVIGSIGLYSVNLYHLSAEIGYTIGKDYINKGYATEAANRVLKFCFEQVKFNRIEAAIAVWNDASVRVAEKLHFMFEGILRKKYFLNPDGFEDMFMYAMLSSDYNNLLEESENEE